MRRAVRALLAIEAVICGGAVTIAFVFNLPLLVLGPLMMLNHSLFASVKSLLWLTGCACALAVFWHLVFSTVNNLRYRFNGLFWAGVSGATFALFEVTSWSESWVSHAIFYAPIVCAIHFIYIQFRRTNKSCPPHPLRGTSLSAPLISNVRRLKITNLSTVLSLAEINSLELSELQDYANSEQLSLADYCDTIALHVAREFLDGRIEFSQGDGVMNTLFSLATSPSFFYENDRVIPPILFDVYLAFDAGEFFHAGDSKDIDPQLKYTKPMISAVLERINVS